MKKRINKLRHGGRDERRKKMYISERNAALDLEKYNVNETIKINK